MRTLLSIVLMLLTFNAYADFKLKDIDKADFKGISEEFAANFMHTSVSPASSLGNIWGVEVGFIAGITEAPKVGNLVKEQDSSENIDKLPHAGILAIATIPLGITGEMTFIPEQSSDNFKFETKSLAAKWTFLSKPFIDMAVKAHYSNTEFKYTDTISSVKTTVSIDQKVYGGHLVLSTDLFIIEPYVGFGFAKGSTDIGATGNVSIFDSSFSTSSSKSNEISGDHIFAGVQLNLLLIHIAGEYSKIFDTEKFTAKFSLYF